MIDFPLMIESLPQLLSGTMMSLLIVGISASLGLIIGSLLALLEKSKTVPFLTGAYITLFRGTPMLVQILFIYYVLPQFGLVVAPFWAASIAIGLNSSAYISQIIKSGINAVPQGQMEAAQTLGFTKFQTNFHIVFPQAFRTTLPALGNEMITLVKDSSLASIIGVVELTKEASIIRSRTYDAFSVLLAVSLIYLLLTGVISFAIKKWESQNHVYS